MPRVSRFLAAVAGLMLLAASVVTANDPGDQSQVCANYPSAMKTTFDFLAAQGTLGTSHAYLGSSGSATLTVYGYRWGSNQATALAAGSYGINDIGLGVAATGDKELDPNYYITLDLQSIASSVATGSQCSLHVSSAETGEGVTPAWGNSLGSFGTATANAVNSQPSFHFDYTFNPAQQRYLSLRGTGTGGANVLLRTLTCCMSQSGFVVGDPQFVGLRGQSYQVHGVSGEIYNIVSDADLQYNSRFVFLSQGACPVVNGKKQKGCFSHPGSYLGELGLKTRAGDKIQLLTGDAKTGFESVQVNGKALEVGDTVLLADNMGSVSLNSTHLASVLIGNWDFAFENSDRFVNQRVRVLDARSLRSHGLLGQTWRETTYPNAIKYIQGAVDDYVIREQDLFGDNFVFNTFN